MSRLPKRLSGIAALSISAVATLMGALPVSAADVTPQVSSAPTSSCSAFFSKYGESLSNKDFFAKVNQGAANNTFWKGGLFVIGNGWHKGQTLKFYKVFNACASQLPKPPG